MSVGAGETQLTLPEKESSPAASRTSPLASDIEQCYRNGWSDGLPVVPPYGSLVDPMVEAMGWKPTEVVGELKELGFEVRAEAIGATAVMAGCLPEYGPLLRELALGLLDSNFNVNGVAVTTGGVAPLVIVSGPIVKRLGFSHEANALGAPNRVNATIGRFAAMICRFCGSAGGMLAEFGTLGHPGKLTFCVAEHPDTAWPPFHTQYGFAKEDSVVTIRASEGPNSVNNHYAQSGDHILETIADCIAHYGSTSFFYQGGGYPERAGYVVVIAPGHMDLVAKTFSREAAHTFILERAVRPTDELIRIGRIPPKRIDAYPVHPGKPRSPIGSPAQLTFLECGCPGGLFSAVIPGWVGNYTITRRIG